ncbi:MAG: alpha/beta fold hydrolase, partial [Proteobacteria bacterium]|nr:alpha/beta fold hydrolase [Pseudomonadota bacterium]
MFSRACSRPRCRIFLLDSLEIEKVDLLGHSMGGMIVQEMAANRPDR